MKKTIANLEINISDLNAQLLKKEKEIENLSKLISEKEKKINHWRNGSLEERLSNCLNQFQSISDTSIDKCKTFKHNEEWY